jgi:lipopolysaccharide transport system ATP-binding protein
MGNTAIRAQFLSKQYTIGEHQPSYRTLRDSISELASMHLRILRRRSGPAREEPTSFWALKNLNFEIQKGDVVGIIGRNGAGKSTLLKVLSRVTELTEGVADIYGRVGSLLEVGTGFHNELTGRENVYLNGAMLGMTRGDINRKFDQIIEFAEVEKFIDTSVKHYSSGMYLRLAFAVAAHLEPEILMVDEVLAVGDLSFQRKCIAKMAEVARQGRTILFVSHNMGAVRALCDKGLVLNRGSIVAGGDVAESIEAYQDILARTAAEEAEQAPLRRFGFTAPCLTSHTGCSIRQADPIEVATTFHIGSEIGGFIMLCVLDDMYQRRVSQIRIDSSDLDNGGPWLGAYNLRIKLPALWLDPGLYTLYFKVLICGADTSEKYVSDMLHIDVTGRPSNSASVLSPPPAWSFENVMAAAH